MALEIAQDRQGSVRVLALKGRLDTETATDLELVVQDLLAAGDRHFLIDLSSISYVSSAGLRVLLATAKQLDGGKGSMRLCGLNAAVKQVFDVAGFSKLFPIFATRAAALDKHPESQPDAQLARDAAQLLGAQSASAKSNPRANDVAQAAAKLLGAKGAAANESPKSKIATPLPPRRAVAKPHVPAPPKPGFLQRIRALFGGK